MKTGFTVLLVSVLSAACFAVQDRGQTVTGRVVDYQARPVGGAKVVCYSSSIGENKYEPLEGAQTTSDGRFSFLIDDKSSSLLLVAGKEGLAIGWKNIDHACDLVPTIRLGKPSRFRGAVVDEAGHPVSGARVRIFLKNQMLSRGEIGPLVPEGWFITETNSQGRFTFDNVPGGSTADFGVDAPGRTSILTFCDFGLGEAEQFAAGQTDISIELPLEARLSGVAVDENTGRVLADVRILARPYSSAGWHDYHCPEPVLTDTDGRFELAGLAPGMYQLQAVSDRAGSAILTVTLKAGQFMRDVKIPLSRGVSFEIAVYDVEKENPVEGADVTVTQKPAESRYAAFSQKVTTDANGLVRLNVPPGECEINVYKSGYGGTFEPQRVQLDLGQVLRHEMFLPRTACILSGKVLNLHGQPIPDVAVMQVRFGPRTLTDANGCFDTSHFQFHTSRLPTRVQVLARHIPSGSAAIGTLEDPNRSGRPKGRITLKPAYTLTGLVTDPNGRGIPAAYVRLLQGRYRTLVTEVLTDPNGAYCIPSVPKPGDNSRDFYTVTARAESFGIAQIVSFPWHENTDEPVRLDPIILLPADRAISGIVEDTNDQPVAGARVWIYGPRLSTTIGYPPFAKTLTDAQGRFRVENVCEEPLRIRVTSPPPQKQTGITWAYGGNENVKVILGQKLQFTPSLIGRSLPELKDLGINPSPAGEDEKAMLICFFDMNQRPSRNCLRQLGERAQELEAKDILVVAIHSSKVDENTLEQWVKKYNIPFPAGIIRGDEEKILFTWGVKSLPWMILADKNRVVCAEGFTVNELRQRISN